MKNILVGDIYETHGQAFRMLGPDTPLTDLVQLFASDSSVLAVFVVNDRQEYMGQVTRLALLRWVALKEIGKESVRSISLAQMKRLIFATKIKDLMKPRDSLPPLTRKSSLASALAIMVDADVSSLAIVDDSRKVIGDLRVSDILTAAVERAN